MKILLLKEEFRGLTFTRNNHSLGCSITFNSLIVPNDCYQNFYNQGFEFLFIEGEKIPDVKPKIKHSAK